MATQVQGRPRETQVQWCHLHPIGSASATNSKIHSHRQATNNSAAPLEVRIAGSTAHSRLALATEGSSSNSRTVSTRACSGTCSHLAASMRVAKGPSSMTMGAKINRFIRMQRLPSTVICSRVLRDTNSHFWGLRPPITAPNSKLSQSQTTSLARTKSAHQLVSTSNTISKVEASVISNDRSRRLEVSQVAIVKATNLTLQTCKVLSLCDFCNRKMLGNPRKDLLLMGRKILTCTPRTPLEDSKSQ